MGEGEETIAGVVAGAKLGAAGLPGVGLDSVQGGRRGVAVWQGGSAGLLPGARRGHRGAGPVGGVARLRVCAGAGRRAAAACCARVRESKGEKREGGREKREGSRAAATWNRGREQACG
jgi:hypothetical protein